MIRSSYCHLITIVWSGLVVGDFSLPSNLTSIWEEFFGGPQTFQSICIAPTALWEFFSYKEVWCALQAPRVHQISGGLMRFLWQKGEIPSFRRSPVTWSHGACISMFINDRNSFSETHSWLISVEMIYVTLTWGTTLEKNRPPEKGYPANKGNIQGEAGYWPKTQKRNPHDMLLYKPVHYVL